MPCAFAVSVCCAAIVSGAPNSMCSTCKNAAAARHIALRLYSKLRHDHAWGERFDEAPSEPVLERMAALAPREMRRAWMTALGNARLAGRGSIALVDLPDGNARRSPIGFVQ